jgi:ABC-type branched-subunit amino acid transport system substrate-binding protein
MAWLFAAVAGGLFACNAFRSTSDCDVDTDCPRGSACDAEGKFCRVGAPIRIAALVPITGNASDQAPERANGMKFGQWLVDRQSSGRVLGRGLAIDARDTLSSAAEIPRVTQEALRSNVALVLGPVSSGDVIESQKATFAAKLLQLAPQAGASAVGDAQPRDPKQRFLFQLIADATQSLGAVAVFLGSAERPARFDACFEGAAIVTVDSLTGRTRRTELERILPRNCVPVTASIEIPQEKKGSYVEEIATLLDASKDGKPTRCLVLDARPDVAGELLRKLIEAQGSRGRTPYSAFLGSPALNTVTFVTEAQSPRAGEPTLAEGFVGWDADGTPDRAEFRDLTALWRTYSAEAGIAADAPLTDITAAWSETVVVTALALELAGSTDSTALRDAFVDLAQPGEGDLVVGPKQIDDALARIRTMRARGQRAAIDYRGAISDFDLDDRGFIQTGVVLWKVENGALGRFRGLTPADLAPGFADPGIGCSRAKK